MFRQAVIADAPGIGLFQTRAWEQTYRGMVPERYLDAVTAEDRARRWADRIASGVDVTLALVDGELIGVASTIHQHVGHGLPDLELRSLYVDRAFHGTGIAVDLLHASIGDRAAHLLVFAANLRAQRFYAKHGFVCTDEENVDDGTGLQEQRWVRLRQSVEPA